MTKLEFKELQVRFACSGTTLKEFLRSEGIAYSTYNYWSKKIKAEGTTMPIAPISIRNESRMSQEINSNSIMDLPGVTLAFLLKTDDIHPPKTGISVHFSSSLP